MLRLQRAIETRATRLFFALDLLGALHLHVERGEDGDGVELDALEHRGEQLEGLALVLVAIVFLRVAAQVDALAQVVHGAEMFAPLLVEHLEHDVLFDVPHDGHADALHLGVVHRVDGADDAAAQRRLLELGLVVEPLRRIHLRREILGDGAGQAGEIPLLVADVRRQVLVEDAADDLGADAADRIGEVGRRP